MALRLKKELQNQNTECRIVPEPNRNGSERAGAPYPEAAAFGSLVQIYPQSVFGKTMLFRR